MSGCWIKVVLIIRILTRVGFLALKSWTMELLLWAMTMPVKPWE